MAVSTRLQLEAGSEEKGLWPEDFQAEKDVLGSCLRSDIGVALAALTLKPSDFYRTYHQLIFAAILAVFRRGDYTTSSDIISELNNRGQLEECGGKEYLHALEKEPMLPENDKWLSPRIEIVKDKSIKRECLRVANEAATLVSDNTLSAAETLERCMALFDSPRERIKPTELPRLITLDDISDTAEPWLWEGWIGRGQLSVLFGPPGAGKSFLMLELAKSATTGEAWPDGTPGPETPDFCLLLDYEGTQVETKQRARALGVPLGMMLLPPPDCNPYLNEPGSLELIDGWIREHHVSLVLVDSLRDSLPGVDEQDSTTIAAALQPLKLIARDNNCAIVIAHHSRKGQINGQERWQLGMDDLRGSGAIAAAARTIMAVDKPDASRETRLLKVVKANNAEKPEPLGFDWHEGRIDWTDAPRAKRSIGALEAAKEAITLTLQAGPKHYAELKLKMGEDGYSERTMNRAIKELENVIVKGQDGRWGLLDRRH